MPNPAKPTQEQYGQLGARLRAVVNRINPPMCEISPVARESICKVKGEHPAVVRVSPLPCGHSIQYCRAAADWFVPKFNKHSCHICEEYPKSYTIFDLSPGAAARIRKRS